MPGPRKQEEKKQGEHWDSARYRPTVLNLHCTFLVHIPVFIRAFRHYTSTFAFTDAQFCFAGFFVLLTYLVVIFHFLMPPRVLGTVLLCMFIRILM